MRNIQGKFAGGVAGWRRVAASVWSRPDDPAIHGFMDIDATNALDYVHGLSEQQGVHVTLTHLVVKALAQAMRKYPECNGIVRWGRIYLRDHVDISALIAIEPADRKRKQGADLTSALIRDADMKSVTDIASELSGGVASIRKRNHDPHLGIARKFFKVLPPAILKRSLLATYVLQYQFNLDLSFTGIMPRDPFGSAMVTSLAMFEIDGAATPIPPFMSLAGIISVGAIKDKPVARNGQVVIRPMMTVGATIDHRVMDGFQAGRLAMEVRHCLQDPEHYLGRLERNSPRPNARPPAGNYSNVKPLRPHQNRDDPERPEP